MNLSITNSVPHKVSLAWFALEEVTVREGSSDLRDAIAEHTQRLREQYDSPAAAAPVLKDGRALYHGLGIDPSKHRPSSEALLRRVLQGKGLFSINTAVDAANLASLTFLLPVGLYDLDQVVASRGEVECRLGEENEEFRGIRKGAIHLGGRLVLVDDAGPFGNPSSDSYRTRVTLDARRLLFVIFAAAGETTERMGAVNRTAIRILQRHVGGQVAAESPSPRQA